MPNKSTPLASPVVEMLKADHEKVKALFEEYKGADSRRKPEIANTAIQELKIHAELEEGLIYPAIREEIDADDLMNEATEEHHLAHVLIAELKSSNRAMRSLRPSLRCSANSAGTLKRKRARYCPRRKRAISTGRSSALRS